MLREGNDGTARSVFERSMPSVPIRGWGARKKTSKNKRLPPLSDIDKMPGDRRRRRHRRRHQVGATLKTLAALEIAVRGRGAALFGVELVGIHRQTHRAARLAPVESGLDEDLVEAFGFRLFLHESRARDDHRIDMSVDRLALGDLRRGA